VDAALGWVAANSLSRRAFSAFAPLEFLHLLLTSGVFCQEFLEGGARRFDLVAFYMD
jgi:hypothetical protein